VVAIVAGSVVCVLVGAFIIFCSIVIRKENKNCPFKTTNFSKCVRMKKADMTKLAYSVASTRRLATHFTNRPKQTKPTISKFKPYL